MKALQGFLATLFFLRKTQYFLGIVKMSLGGLLIFLSISFSASWGVAQDRCADVYPHQWATELITQPMGASRPELFIEDLSMGRVMGLLERPIHIFEFVGGRNHRIGPLVLHNITQFPSYFRGIIQGLFVRSVRESWVWRGADQMLQSRFEEWADIQGKTPQQVREFFEKDPVTFMELFKDEYLQINQRGVEVAQFVVEFQDGSRIASGYKTDYLVDAVYDPHMILEPLFQSLPNKPIKALHFFHTHPAEYPGSAGALSLADIKLLETVRLDMLHQLPRQNIETIDFHMYAVARAQRQLLIGHYSERGWGFE